jgi:hypothetical protein
MNTTIKIAVFAGVAIAVALPMSGARADKDGVIYGTGETDNAVATGAASIAASGSGALAAHASATANRTAAIGLESLARSGRGLFV